MTKATTPRAKEDRLPPLWGRERETGYRVQPTAQQIIEGVRLRGGELWLDDNYDLCARLPKRSLKQLKAVLKQHRAGVFQYLLERRPKTEIQVACRCSEKSYPHLVHNPPRGDEQPEIHIKGGFKELLEALIRCQCQPEGWDMGDLVEYMEELSKRKSE